MRGSRDRLVGPLLEPWAQAHTTESEEDVIEAVGCRGYGRPARVLRLENVPVPDLRANGVRVAIHAASVTFSNLLSVTGGPFPIGLLLGWVRKPKTLIVG